MAEVKFDWKDKIAELLYVNLKFGCTEKCTCHAECNKAEQIIEQVYKLINGNKPQHI